MSETSPLLHVRAAGREFVLSVQDLREVVAFTAVAPLPGGPPGIEGVVLHQGEFLPVLDWKVLPGGEQAGGAPTALAVLWPRLGLPLERLIATLDPPAEGWRDLPEEEGWNGLMSGVGRVGDQELPRLDPDRVLALLHRLRTVR